MPIKPENRDKYPDDWPQIRERIMRRAGDACECRGECGSEHFKEWVREGFGMRAIMHCGAPHGEIIFRNADDPARWRGAAWWDGETDSMIESRSVEVILTIAHLDHDPTNNSDENLRAFCQRCHNVYDEPHRRQTRALTRLRRQPQLDFGGEW